MEGFYIKHITIKNLWGKDIFWELKSDVNILVGGNGSGKSTILTMIESALSPKQRHEWEMVRTKFSPINELEITLGNDLIITIDEYGGRSFEQGNQDYSLDINQEELLDSFKNVILIKTFDNKLKEVYNDLNTSGKYGFQPDHEQDTILSLRIKGEIRSKFKDFEADFGSLLEKVYENDREVSEQEKQDLEKQKSRRIELIQKINHLFGITEKEFDRKAFAFRKKGQTELIEIEDLSSGEKQALYIIFTAFFQNEKPCIFLLDEPETSLDTEWQKLLIVYIRDLNPYCQVIAATHSPSIFYLDWSENLSILHQLLKPSTSHPIRRTVVSSQSIDYEKINAVFSGISRQNPEKATMRLIVFNQKVQNIYEVSFEEAQYIVLTKSQDLNINPDVITYTTLIGKLRNFEESKNFLALMAENKIQPNNYTINNLLKKITQTAEHKTLVERAFSELETLTQNYPVKPDIFTFSIILGKARTSDEAKKVEEMRHYYKVEATPIYIERLKHRL